MAAAPLETFLADLQKSYSSLSFLSERSSADQSCPTASSGDVATSCREPVLTITIVPDNARCRLSAPPKGGGDHRSRRWTASRSPLISRWKELRGKFEASSASVAAMASSASSSTYHRQDGRSSPSTAHRCRWESFRGVDTPHVDTLPQEEGCKRKLGRSYSGTTFANRNIMPPVAPSREESPIMTSTQWKSARRNRHEQVDGSHPGPPKARNTSSDLMAPQLPSRMKSPRLQDIYKHQVERTMSLDRYIDDDSFSESSQSLGLLLCSPRTPVVSNMTSHKLGVMTSLGDCIDIKSPLQ